MKQLSITVVITLSLVLFSHSTFSAEDKAIKYTSPDISIFGSKTANKGEHQITLSAQSVNNAMSSNLFRDCYSQSIYSYEFLTNESDNDREYCTALFNLDLPAGTTFKSIVFRGKFSNTKTMGNNIFIANIDAIGMGGTDKHYYAGGLTKKDNLFTINKDREVVFNFEGDNALTFEEDTAYVLWIRIANGRMYNISINYD